jgi:hypothetical protein
VALCSKWDKREARIIGYGYAQHVSDDEAMDRPNTVFALLDKRREKLAAIGVRETEANLRNKISRGGFTGAFLIRCLVAMGVTTLHLED